MKKINLSKTQTKVMGGVIVSMVLATGVIFASNWYMPDDTPIKNTWQSSYYSNNGLTVAVSDLTTSIVTGESFFTLVQDGKSIFGKEENIKLSLHALSQDGTLVPIKNVSQLTISSTEKENLTLTGYSFFWPENTYHLQVTITALNEANELLNQQIIYLDQRKAQKVESAFDMNTYVTNELSEWQKPKIDESEMTNQVKNPTAIKEESQSSETLSGDDVETPNEEIQEPTGTLQQSYVIEESEQVQSDHVEEIVETETPQYTLADLEHQLSKAKEELNLTPDDEALKQKVADLEKQIQEMKSVEAEISSSDNGASDSHE